MSTPLETRIDQARTLSQTSTRDYMTQLNHLLSSIWWRFPPQVLQSAPADERVQFFASWVALSPTELLTSIMPLLYAEREVTLDEVDKVILSAKQRLVDTWNELIDVFRWTPKDYPDTPVIWYFPKLVDLAFAFADAVIDYHHYIYTSMQGDMDTQTRDGFFDLLMKLNTWVGQFKRTWQGAAWVDHSFEEVKPVVRPDVRVQLDRVLRS